MPKQPPSSIPTRSLTQAEYRKIDWLRWRSLEKEDVKMLGLCYRALFDREEPAIDRCVEEYDKQQAQKKDEGV